MGLGGDQGAYALHALELRPAFLAQGAVLAAGDQHVVSGEVHAGVASVVSAVSVKASA
jgi:hypothetical protein